MTLATLLPGMAPGRPLNPGNASRSRPVGAGWEVLLMPGPLAERDAHVLGRATMAASALGWVFALAGQRGIFLPERCDIPVWPPGTTYLKTGASVTLPPFHWRLAERGSTGG
ncbi:hypothetical protein [Streptomyces nigrescens]|uniref:hypothetical protein n=1 Tax=Streptomyces nigrescens TaxID=1920 RepID=UPI0036FB7DE4